MKVGQKVKYRHQIPTHDQLKRHVFFQRLKIINIRKLNHFGEKLLFQIYINIFGNRILFLDKF